MSFCRDSCRGVYPLLRRDRHPVINPGADWTSSSGRLALLRTTAPALRSRPCPAERDMTSSKPFPLQPGSSHGIPTAAPWSPGKSRQAWICGLSCRRSGRIALRPAGSARILVGRAPLSLLSARACASRSGLRPTIRTGQGSRCNAARVEFLCEGGGFVADQPARSALPSPPGLLYELRGKP
jgi:hypothetical protein